MRGDDELLIILTLATGHRMKDLSVLMISYYDCFFYTMLGALLDAKIELPKYSKYYKNTVI